MAIVPALGTSWRSSSSRLPPTVPAMKTTPVTLPPGRLRLVTRPSLTGSLPVVNTIGIVVVDDLARIAAKVLLTITEGRRAITSAARVSKPSKRFSAQTNSIATFCPSTSPVQTVAKCRQIFDMRRWRAAVEKDDHRHGLLRAHDAWQCDRRAAYKCNELTPPHCYPRGSGQAS